MIIALATAASAQCSSLLSSPPGTNLNLGDDSVRTVGLGFTFPFHGQNYSTISVASNGFVWLGRVTESDLMLRAIDWIDNEPDLLAWAPRIAACWDDWNPASPLLQPGGGVFFRTDGQSASVVWKGVPENTASPVFANMEVVLTVGGRIDLRYGTAMGSSSDDNIAGISAGNGAAPNALDWTTSVPGPVASGTAYELFGPLAFDLAGQTLTFLPNNPAASSYSVVQAVLPSCPTPAVLPLATAPLANGTGCPGLVGTNTTAIHELFTPAGGTHPDDLQNQSITFARAGTTYIATPGPGFDNSYLVHGHRLPQEDETMAIGLSLGAMGSFPFGSLLVDRVDAAANGYLLLQTGEPSQWLPNLADFLAGPSRIAPHWSDLDLYFQGAFYWQNDDPAFCMATWDAAEEFAMPGVLSTFQCKLWANGDITFSYGAVNSQADDVLVGITLGQGATAGAADDISASPTLPLIRDLGSLQLPLRHSVSGPASIRAPIQLLATNLPSGTAVGAFVVSQTAQTLDLTNLGMPSCFAYVGIDDVYTVAANVSMSLTFDVPATPFLLGLTMHTQAAALAPLNAAGIVTSNRMTVTIGL